MPPAVRARKLHKKPHSDPGFTIYGLASRKSFTIGTMMAMRCISVTWVVLGKMANRDAERGLHVAVDLATLKAKHLRDVREPYAVSVAVDEKHGRRGGLELVGSEVVPFRGRGGESLDELRKVVRSRTQLLVLDFDGRAFEIVRREIRDSFEPLP